MKRCSIRENYSTVQVVISDIAEHLNQNYGALKENDIIC